MSDRAPAKLDLPLANAEPISDYGSTSGVMYLRREKTTCTPPAQEWSENIQEKKTKAIGKHPKGSN